MAWQTLGRFKAKNINIEIVVVFFMKRVNNKLSPLSPLEAPFKGLLTFLGEGGKPWAHALTLMNPHIHSLMWVVRCETENDTLFAWMVGFRFEDGNDMYVPYHGCDSLDNCRNCKCTQHGIFNNWQSLFTQLCLYIFIV